MSRPRRRLASLAAAVVLVPAGQADAATVGRVGDRIVFAAGAAEVNDVGVYVAGERPASEVTLSDDGSDLRLGPGCRYAGGESRNVVRCDVAGITGIDLRLGDLDDAAEPGSDRLSARPATALPVVISGGAGNDDLSVDPQAAGGPVRLEGGSGNDSLPAGRRTPTTLVGGTGSDWMFARETAADVVTTVIGGAGDDALESEGRQGRVDADLGAGDDFADVRDGAPRSAPDRLACGTGYDLFLADTAASGAPPDALVACERLGAEAPREAPAAARRAIARVTLRGRPRAVFGWAHVSRRSPRWAVSCLAERGRRVGRIVRRDGTRYRVEATIRAPSATRARQPAAVRPVFDELGLLCFTYPLARPPLVPTIVPGDSIAGVERGDRPRDVRRALGAPQRRSRSTWTYRARGITVFFAGGRVDAVRTTSTRDRDPDGRGPGIVSSTSGFDFCRASGGDPACRLLDSPDSNDMLLVRIDGRTRRIISVELTESDSI